MNCIIVAGANGELGKEFIRKFVSNNKVIGISRSVFSGMSHPNLVSLKADLTKPEELEAAFSDFDPTQYKKVILVHCIGTDKFENTHYPKIEPLETLDPLVYTSNVNTYKYIARLLIKKIQVAREIRPVKLKLVLIGSIADKYGLLVITSYSEAKNIVRSYMRDAASVFPWVSALVINIGSMRTPGAFKVRPYADTTYWLSVKEVVDFSWQKILHQWKRYKEINIFKKDPDFKENYYLNDKAIFERWAKQVWGK